MQGLLAAGKGEAVSPQIWRATSLLEEEGKEGYESLSSVGEGLSADLRALKLPAVLGPMTSEALASPAGRGLGLPWGPPLSPPTLWAHPSLSLLHTLLSLSGICCAVPLCLLGTRATASASLPMDSPTPALHWLEKGML